LEKLIVVKFAIDPRNTALLGIDLQNCFVGKSPLPLRAGWSL
jgi:hypothetical protein